MLKIRHVCAAFAVSIGFMAGCGDNLPSTTPTTPDAAVTANVDSAVDVTATVSQHSIGGTITGLLGSGLVLQQPNGSELPVLADGTFVFPDKVASGQPYVVAVKTQPMAPKQTCSVMGGAGQVAAGNVTTILVNCTTDTFAVGGTVSGLSGTGLMLSIGSGEPIPVNANGAFAFATPLSDASPYAVTVTTQPRMPSQTCVVGNGAGSIASAVVTNVSVTCTVDSFAIGGTVSGLSGSGLVLQNNAGDDLAVAAAGTVSFANSLKDGANYAVTVKTQPTQPAQTCTVMGGSGTLAGGKVETVLVSCAIDQFAVGGTVNGLAGAGLVLQNNAGDDLNVSANGTFAFPTPISDLTNYAVTVKTQPQSPWQTCSVTEGSGTMAGKATTNVQIDCSTNTYAVGGTLEGLAPGASVEMQNAAGDDLTLTSNGAFHFATHVVSGVTYTATVSVQPSSPVVQTCIITDGTGNVAGTDVSNIKVQCTTNEYSVGGTVSGLAGTGLKLKLGAMEAAISDNGVFTFPMKLESGTPYEVSVGAQPTSPSQTCAVSGASGTVVAGNIEGVSINCSTDSFTVGGSITGLDGSGLTLQNNGADDLAVNANGSFAFATTLTDLTAYAVTVKSNPAGKSQTCSVANGSGNLAGDNVASVVITCTTNTFTVGGTVAGLDPSEQVVLTNNATDQLTVMANGSFAFGTALADGASYAVTVVTSPTDKPCRVKDATGTINGANVNTVKVVCGCGVNDDFNDNDISDWQKMASQESSTFSPGRDGTGYGFKISGGGSHYMGFRQTFDSARPTYISTWLRASANNMAHNYFILRNDNFKFAIFLLAHSSGQWSIVAGNSAVSLAPIAAGTWTKFEMYLNWETKTIDYHMNGVLIKSNQAFRDNITDSVTTLDLYNLAATDGHYDDIVMTCK